MDLDPIRDIITPRIMQYSAEQVLIDRLVEFNDASRKLNHAIIVHKEVLAPSGEVANRWTDERTRASNRPLLGRFLACRGPLGSIGATGLIRSPADADHVLGEDSIHQHLDDFALRHVLRQACGCPHLASRWWA